MIVRATHPRWKWRVALDFSVRLRGVPESLRCRLIGSDGAVYAAIKNGVIHVYADYHFDGCTCAPDHEDAIKGCCVHDAMLQMTDQHPGVFPEQAAHDALRDVQRAEGFRWAWLYHWAVSGLPRRIYKLVRKLNPNRKTHDNPTVHD